MSRAATHGPKHAPLSFSVAMDHRAAAEQALEGRLRPESAPFAGAVKTNADDVTARVAGGATTAAEAHFTCAECAKCMPFACFKSVCDVREFLIGGWCQGCQDAFSGQGH